MRKQLTRSGWTASWDPNRPRTVWLDYEGIEFKRSQSVIRYSEGHYGWDWPEVVPESVMYKVEAILERNAAKA